FQPDIINIHDVSDHLAFYQTRSLQNKKYFILVTLHGLVDKKYCESASRMKLWKMARFVNAVSYALAKQLMQMNTQYKQSIKCIYNGAPKLLLPLNCANINSSSILAIGRLSSEKGFEVLFYAMKELSKKYPHLELIMIGDGDQMTYLAALKNKLNLDNKIKMTGFVAHNDIIHFIDEAQLVVIPSHYESFGMVALEAGQRKKPVVASDVGGLKEVIAHNKTGILVEPNNPHALASVIDQLLSNPKKMQQLGTAAEKRVRRHFTIEKTAQKYLSMYEAAIGEAL
ncbi:MAG: glycosyltransferase family 4 protein, partial [Gammaproteobacteria bacterium]|nr:glycosyltransferase family 4 protein [Gammaproteobacteria bacterium]